MDRAKKEYKKGEQIQIKLKGSKPFYAIVVYRDAENNLLQILPNPYRTENYFQAGTEYKIPSDQDRFDLEISPPFGDEEIILFADCQPLGHVQTRSLGSVYAVETPYHRLGSAIRGPTAGSNNDNRSNATEEFLEKTIKIVTGP